MTDHPDSETKERTTEPPAPEVLRAQTDDKSSASDVTASVTPKLRTRLRHGTYRPSHKATFIGLAVVVMILAVNAGVIAFLMKNQTKTGSSAVQSEVTISPTVLDKLGVSRNTVGSSGTELVVSPNSTFNNKLTVGGDVSIAGKLKLNGQLSATDVDLTKLVAGDTTLDKLNVNGDATATNLNLRKDLTVAGSSLLQGAVTVSQLLTVNSNMNILGNLSVGGVLSMGAFQTNTLTIGGHITTRGTAPSVSPGSALGSNGTVSISGNDVSGTVAVNIGAGGGSGIVAYVSFVNQYGNIPHVVVTAVGRGAGSVYVNRSSTGFSIGVNGSLDPGGYAFDYIVMQ
jgi:cytoskeletal protein CcmA (bactofilin family)